MEVTQISRAWWPPAAAVAPAEDECCTLAGLGEQQRELQAAPYAKHHLNAMQDGSDAVMKNSPLCCCCCSDAGAELLRTLCLLSV